MNPIDDKNNIEIDIIVNYIPVPINTLKNNIPDGGLKTSLLTYFHPVYSINESFSSYGRLSNFNTSLLIVNLIKYAINPTKIKKIIKVIPIDNHYY